MKPFITILLYFVIFAFQLQAAEFQFQVGQEYSNIINLKVNGKVAQKVPLLPGTWVVTAMDDKSATSGPGSSAAHSGALLSRIYFGNVTDGKLTGLMKVTFTPIRGSRGWKASKLCYASGFLHLEGRGYDGTQTDCWGVRATPLRAKPGTPGERSNNYWLEKGFKFPRLAIMTTYAKSNRSEYLVVSYFLNPEAEGVSPPKDVSRDFHDYRPDRISGFPDKKAYVEKKIEWAKAWKLLVDLGFQNKLTLEDMGRKPKAAPADTTNNTNKKSADGSIKSKLKQIKKLVEEGLITEEEGAAKRKSVLEGL